MEPIRVRPTDREGDREARATVVRHAWEDAYSRLFSPEEIAAVFEGRLPMHGNWTTRREAPAGTLVAEVGGEVVGIVSTGRFRDGDGEVAALYVQPGHQGRGVGTRLWEAAVTHLREAGCTRLEVWTLSQGPAMRFYPARGCHRFATGSFRIGEHAEEAAGFELAL